MLYISGYYQSEEEKEAIENYIRKLKENNVFLNKITTEIIPLKNFYYAEEYHQDYEKKNPNNPYVRAISIPRLKRFKQQFPHLLKN